MKRGKILHLVLLAIGMSSAFAAFAENYPLIIRGKVTMPDGSPPPIRVAVERYCSDGVGSAPGPLTNKNGEYLWRMDVDPMRTRACVIRATHAGYVSTAIDISALNGYLSTTTTLDPIIISSPSDDPYTISLSESSMPVRSKSELKSAMKALDSRNYAEAASLLRQAVAKTPDYARGWHALGVVLDHEDAIKESKDAFEKAIAADSRFLPPYFTLVSACRKLQDWNCILKTGDALAKVDKKKEHADIDFRRAIAQYRLNDLEAAAATIQDVLRIDKSRRIPRAEYVYGRILQAKGDIPAAREHMSRYLEIDKNAPDALKIRRHIENLEKPHSEETEPELDFP